jgi:drug/metabolite transporter (DMT)-like permease
MTHPTKPSPLLILLGLVTIYLVWGSTYLAIRVAVTTMPPFLMASCRFLVAGLVVAFVIQMLRGFHLSSRQWFDNAIVGGFMLLGGNGLVSWAEKSIPSGIATLIVSLSPLFFVFAEWGVSWWRQDPSKTARPNGLTFAGLALGTLGLCILVGPSFSLDTESKLELLPVLALVLACICWTIGSLYSRYAKNAADPFTGSAAQMMCGGVWLILVSLLCGELQTFSIANVSAESMAAWFYLLVAGSLIAFTTFVWLMKHCSPTIVSTYAYVNPIVAVFLGWFLLNESVSPHLVIASIAIVLGVALITISKKQSKSRI